VRRTGSRDRKTTPVYRKQADPPELWEGKIDRLAWGGAGVAHHADGRILLLKAPLALFPGETVRAEVRWKVRHGEGEVTAWLKSSPDRSQPGCPVAGRCGGCELQGAGDEAEVLKRAMVADLLHRQFPEFEAWTWHPAPPEALRHRIQLHWNGKELGFHARSSHRVIPIHRCPVAAPLLSEAIPRLQDAIEGGVLPRASQRWELVTGSPANRVWAVDERDRAWTLEPDGWSRDEGPVRHRHEEISLKHRPGGFFQVCAPWAMEAFGKVLLGWDLRGETLYDLYGGVGLFSALLGSRFARRVLVESEERAVDFARTNLAEAGLSVEAIAEPVETWLPEALGQAGDMILLDPPRTGLDPVVRERLLGAQADQMVLVGCDGAAFCRDVKALAPAWKLLELSVLDLFPLTHHAEFVARLGR